MTSFQFYPYFSSSYWLQYIWICIDVYLFVIPMGNKIQRLFLHCKNSTYNMLTKNPCQILFSIRTSSPPNMNYVCICWIVYISDLKTFITIELIEPWIRKSLILFQLLQSARWNISNPSLNITSFFDNPTHHLLYYII